MVRAGELPGSMTGELHRQEEVHVMITGNERGIALILALVLITLLTMLGAWALDTSSTDLKIAGNYRNAETAFSMADTAASYAGNPNTLQLACGQLITCSPFTGTMTTWPTPTISISSNIAAASVEYLSKGPLPAGAIYNADVVNANGQQQFTGLYFVVTANGNGPNAAAARIETGVVQVVSN